MTITFLKLYNDIASQPWSMFDSGAETAADFEPALVSSINKAIIDIWYSYPFSFRIKNYNIITLKNYPTYKLPNGNLLPENSIEENLFAVKSGSNYLNYVDEFTEPSAFGQPKEFVIENDYIIFSPTPDKRYQISIKYLTLSIGFNQSGNEIYALENTTDYIDIPAKYEELFKNTVIAKTLLESITSVNDENYLGYKLQFDKAYKLLIKISNPARKNMSVSI